MGRRVRPHPVRRGYPWTKPGQVRARSQPVGIHHVDGRRRRQRRPDYRQHRRPGPARGGRSVSRLGHSRVHSQLARSESSAHHLHAQRPRRAAHRYRRKSDSKAVDLRFLVLATALTAAAIPSNAEGLPDGPGKNLVEAICSDCHTTERIADQHLTKTQWADKVLEMLQEAPDVKQSERDTIVEYLAKNFPPRAIVNKASAKELQAILEISPESATAVVNYRQQNGSFKTLDDLKKVPGVDAAKLDAKRDVI